MSVLFAVNLRLKFPCADDVLVIVHTFLVDKTVATLVFDDEYVNAPVLFDEGSVRLNDTSVPTVFVGMVARAPIVGVIPSDGPPTTQFDVAPDNVKFDSVPFLADVDVSTAVLPEVELSL
jgi:hypothetical protein